MKKMTIEQILEKYGIKNNPDLADDISKGPYYVKDSLIASCGIGKNPICYISGEVLERCFRKDGSTIYSLTNYNNEIGRISNSYKIENDIRDCEKCRNEYPNWVDGDICQCEKEKDIDYEKMGEDHFRKLTDGDLIALFECKEETAIQIFKDYTDDDYYSKIFAQIMNPRLKIK